MLLNVLSRKGDGCKAMRTIIADCHNTEYSKKSLRRRAFQLFRALVERNIIEINDPKKSDQKLQVNVELQDDFSLNQTLSLYCIDALGLLNTEDPQYPYKLLSIVESILENPDVILRRQLDVLKSEKMAEMKAAGIEYDQRIEKLDSMEYPKPESEFIYDTFNEFAQLHPWVGAENIKPKSIAREMFERYSSFSDYVKLYGLARSEGLLLRHLTNAYRVLENTVPTAFKTESVNEITVYLEHLLKNVDSSLLDEWERLRNPDYTKEIGEELPVPAGPIDITRNKNSFMRLIRNEVFSFIRLLANRQYSEIAKRFDLKSALSESGGDSKWEDIELAKLLDPFYETRGWIRLDPEARSVEHTHVSKDEDNRIWTVEQTLVDSEEQNDWLVAFSVDITESKTSGKVSLAIIRIGPLRDH